MVTLSSGFLLLFGIIAIVWMVQMLKLTRETRIVNSMTLKVLLKYCEQKGVNIDIEKIQREVEDKV